MSEPHAYFDGRWMPASQVALPVHDAGFVLGATVTEQLRTFQGQLFCLDEHLERLFHSLALVEIDPGLTAAQLGRIARRVAAHNHPLLQPGDDLGLAMFVTPGPYPALAGGKRGGPLVCVHSYPLQFQLWAEKYQRGEAVAVSDVRQVPPECWPAELKCRSRMHYYLADKQAAQQHPGARAILLDQQGSVSEATTANVVLYHRSEGLVSPPREKILPGISLMVLARLAGEQGIALVHRDVRPEELRAADEILLTSTSVCVLPVTACNGRPVGAGAPGPVFHQLLRAWSEQVGVDIPQQARSFARQ